MKICGRKNTHVLTKDQVTKRLDLLSMDVKKIVETQESSGAWITKNDRFKKRMPDGERWNGQYLVMDRIKQ